MSLSPQKEPERQVLWEPTPKQSEFLSAPEWEVLYGGAAGGGKSDALLIDALGLQQDAITQRDYQAALFRRTFPELRDLIDRSREIYDRVVPGAKYNKTDHVWTFPSGARVELAHLHHENDRLKYRGRAFQYVGWDELTLWPTAKPYLYLTSRVRSANPKIRCYIRGTTNPDGAGFDWVQERFQIPPAGTATRIEYEVTDDETGETFKRVRRFIPAKLTDNKFLKDTDYRIALLELPKEERDALLRGLWVPPSTVGAYYTEEFKQADEEGRITDIPILKGYPVDTFWDLGANDTTAIWLMQRVGMQDRFIACYENSGEGLSHYAKWLLEQGLIYGTHYLPHDAEQQKLGKEDTRSNKQMLEELLPGHSFEVVPVISDVLVGINETRAAFPKACFDRTRCADGIKALRAYKKKWDPERQAYLQRPLHDWSSNYADAFRQWGQIQDEMTGTTTFKRRGGGSWKTL